MIVSKSGRPVRLGLEIFARGAQPARRKGESLALREKPLSAQAKPGRPSGDDKEKKVFARASGRGRRAVQRDVRQRRLVGVKTHGTLDNRFEGAKASGALAKIAGAQRDVA
jgi:hypothetical protein